MIGPFKGKYKFLCNFYRLPVTWGGVEYPTVEHAYQAEKLTDEWERMAVRECATPGQAKRYARSRTCRDDWFAINMGVMESLLRQKFRQGSELAEQLDETGDEHLVEVNHWGDTYWGAVWRRGALVGDNHLGRLLMAIRSERREREN